MTTYSVSGESFRCLLTSFKLKKNKIYIEVLAELRNTSALITILILLFIDVG